MLAGHTRADHQECREHAERCRELARAAANAEARASYLEAAEIEGAQAFIRTMAEIVGRGEPGQSGQAEPEAA